MKTSELAGTTLDWAVAKCEGWSNEAIATQTIMGSCNFSKNWAQGGPIIERKELQTYPLGSFGWGSSQNDGSKQHTGPTPLIAAMRCFVASQLGDEIEIPEELK